MSWNEEEGSTSNVEMSDCSGAGTQIWTFEDGEHMKWEVANNQCMTWDIGDGSGRNVAVQACHEGFNQNWYWEGSNLKSRQDNSFCVAWGAMDNVYMDGCDDTQDQKWFKGEYDDGQTVFHRSATLTFTTCAGSYANTDSSIFVTANEGSRVELINVNEGSQRQKGDTNIYTVDYQGQLSSLVLDIDGDDGWEICDMDLDGSAWHSTNGQGPFWMDDMSGCGTNQEPCFTTVDVLDYFRGGGHVATNAEGEEVVVLTECDSGPGDGSGGWEQYLIQTESMQACANYVSTNYPEANGATWGPTDVGPDGDSGEYCYAEFGQTGSTGDGSVWENCFLEPQVSQYSGGYTYSGDYSYGGYTYSGDYSYYYYYYCEWCRDGGNGGWCGIEGNGGCLPDASCEDGVLDEMVTWRVARMEAFLAIQREANGGKTREAMAVKHAVMQGR